MSTSSIPEIQFSPTGLILPDASAVLAGLQADMNAAFGGNLNPALSTPQGQLASSEAVIITAKNDQFAKFVNQVDPATASGSMQDAIGQLYFMDRLPATATSVQVLCTGLAGVVIPVGALVSDTQDVRYACVDGGVISSGGTVTLTFAATTTGPVACAAGAIAQIYQAVIGWDRVTNVAEGIIGSNVESRADFEYRRQQSVALNAVGSLPSIYAAVFDVPGVSDVFVTENTTGSSLTVGGVTLVAHSVYVAAVGGTSAAVAAAIWRKKSIGANYNGNTSVTVLDSSYPAPRPAYIVKFQRPTATPILFAVEIDDTGSLPANIVTLVKNAIIDAFAGGDGGPRARIGSTIYASRFYAPVAAVAPLSIVSLLLGVDTATSNTVTLDIDQAPTISASDITVTLV